jgi:gamma-glutamyl-gamma-aminobutyrate hydrolase PuuD
MGSSVNTWASQDIPQFKGQKAFLLEGAFHASCKDLMISAGFSLVDNVADCDVVVFEGGSDIDTQLYGEKSIVTSSYWAASKRDAIEVKAYREAQELGKVCFGICRGAQFLHAMNGGTLWQDVNNHSGTDHLIYDLEEDVILSVNSYHHQMLRINTDIEVVAVTPRQIANKFKAEGITIIVEPDAKDEEMEVEIEAGIYHDTNCFFVQGHPEVGTLEYKSWTFSKLKAFMDHKESLQLTIPLTSINTINDVEESLQQWREANALCI